MGLNTGATKKHRGKYKSVSIPRILVVAAEQIVSSENSHGYTSASGLMTDAIRRRVEELQREGTC